MAAQPKVLFVLSSHDAMGNTGKPTGWYLPEFAHPWHELHEHVEIDVASPKGGKAPLDPSSAAKFQDETSQKFLKEQTALWENTKKLSDIVGKSAEYSAIFYVGGHGPMFDLATDETSHQVIREFWESGKIVSAVCHGPAALVNAKLSDGSYLIDGAAVTSFSNEEEDIAQLSHVVPFMLEDRLVQNGGKFEKSDKPFTEKVCIAKDGRLITGQNPASATPIGKAVLQAITA